uniref:Uncharacterized protein n=2 Tax=Astyanax mexicanus TaxID=7994 RepID=A0A8B9LVQ6_ASTMX
MRNTSHKHWKHNNLILSVKHVGGSIIVCVAFIDLTMNFKLYMGILKENVITSVHKLNLKRRIMLKMQYVIFSYRSVYFELFYWVEIYLLI